mgnify:CR=1 FL=1
MLRAERLEGVSTNGRHRYGKDRRTRRRFDESFGVDALSKLPTFRTVPYIELFFFLL